MMGIFCPKPEETESKQTVQWQEGKQEGKKEMTREEIMRIALEQSAIDANCRPEDFTSGQNRTVISKANEKARKYLELPSYCMLISYGDNIVASVDPAVSDEVEKYLGRFQIGHCFGTPNLYLLNDLFARDDRQICFMAEYFLPDSERLRAMPCDYEIRILFPEDLESLYLPQWSNALSSQRRELDVLAAGAWHEGKLMGLAGCSADCDTMWQIGVDVLPAYRRQGIAAALTSRLALEILERGKVPFYCAAWANLKSVRNAIRCGFEPAWVEVDISMVIQHR